MSTRTKMSRRAKALKKYPKVDPAVVNGLFDQDPSRGALGGWMVGRVAEGESHEEVLDAVRKFHAVKKRLPKDARDLYAYEDVEEVLEMVKSLPPSKREGRRTAKGYTVLRELPQVTFYRVDTFRGMCALGRDTKWCTTSQHTYERLSDCIFVVAVSRLRRPRDPYSKIIMASQNAWNPDPNRFISYKNQRKDHMYVRRCAWDFYDAKDHHVTGRYGTDDPSPLEELLDMLVGERGSTREILIQAQGGAPYLAFFEDVVAPFVRKGGAAKGARVAEMARLAAEHGLFNPLSLLDHPSARSRQICAEISSLATDKQWEVLSAHEVRLLAARPAVNVPEVFERLTTGGDRLRMSRTEMANILLKNKNLTKEAKHRVAEYVRRQVLGI